MILLRKLFGSKPSRIPPSGTEWGPGNAESSPGFRAVSMSQTVRNRIPSPLNHHFPREPCINLHFKPQSQHTPRHHAPNPTLRHPRRLHHPTLPRQPPRRSLSPQQPRRGHHTRPKATHSPGIQLPRNHLRAPPREIRLHKKN